MITPIEIGRVPSPIVLTSGNMAIRTIRARDNRKIATDSFAPKGNSSFKVVLVVFRI